MPAFIVTMVGTQSCRVISAGNDYEAVAEAAGCSVSAVCLPIWRRGATAAQAYRQEYRERCYMPRDNSGRQWIVTDLQEG